MNRYETQLRALRAAFPYTIPIFAGFWFLGLTYGIYMNVSGFSFLYPMLMSLTIFAGSVEFITVNLLLGAFNPFQALFLTLMVNARHLFYGLALLEKYRGLGWKKPYLIFGLCDETFSIHCAVDPPPGVDKGWFYFFITLLDQSYWILGSVIGGVAGAVIPFSTEGVDFAMTALFVVIAVEQWKTYRKHLPALLGCAVTVVFLIILGSVFGQDQMLLISLGVIVLILLILRDRLDEKEGEPC